MRRIKIDYDERIPRDFAKRLQWIADTVPFTIRRVERLRSQNGGHHVIVHVSDIPLYAAIMVQAMMGSDYKRETFNLVRVMKLAHTPRFWRARLNVLYASKEQERTQ